MPNNLLCFAYQAYANIDTAAIMECATVTCNVVLLSSFSLFFSV